MRTALTWVFWIVTMSAVFYGMGLLYAWRVGVI